MSEFTVRIFESGSREDRVLTVTEVAEQKVSPWKFSGSNRFVYRPSNQLRLEVGRNRYGNDFTLADGSNLPLSERLGELPLKLREAAQRFKLREQIRAEERERAAVRQRAHHLRVESKRSELASLAKAEELADRLVRAGRLRELVNALEVSGGLEGEEGAAKLAWMRNAADWLDPTIGRHWPEVDDVKDTPGY